MAGTGKQRTGVQYRITVKGVLDSKWSDWFDGMTITPGSLGQTELSGQVFDQAALHGVLTKIRDLGLTLVSIQTIDLKGVQNEIQSPPL